MSEQKSNINFSDLLGSFVKDEFMRKITEQRAEREITTNNNEQDASEEVVARVKVRDELDRRFYLDFALRIMIDANSAEGMNYSWQDVVTVSEKVRAYVEAGAYIDTGTAWKNVPKLVDDDPFETLGS